MPHHLRIVFMGTPDFAVASLKKLLEEEYPVVGVITAPDKPAGRGKKLLSSPVKKFAMERGIQNILQPANLKDPGFLAELKSLNADLQVVVAFRMLPEAVWSMPPRGTINLHASLLPDYRGAAPINWAIINGEKETGVSTFFIEKEIDTGKILFQDTVSIPATMDAGELHDTLMILGAELLDKTLSAIEGGTYSSVPQSVMLNTRKEWNAAPKIFREDCQIDWKKPVPDIYNFIRGLSPYPAAYTYISDGEKDVLMKIFRSTVLEGNPSTTPMLETDGKTYIRIAHPDGILNILELQLEGRKRMKTDEFLRGFKEMGSYTLAE
ncbi:MAG: methionyl-tRNA formyltransferase [Bacteroidales bacterium]|nr:methionyl-tRNA formyltransferase [Bacteroidales bacterium]